MCCHHCVNTTIQQAIRNHFQQMMCVRICVTEYFGRPIYLALKNVYLAHYEKDEARILIFFLFNLGLSATQKIAVSYIHVIFLFNFIMITILVHCIDIRRNYFYMQNVVSRNDFPNSREDALCIR